MENITKEYITVIDDDLAKDMIALGSRELTLANVSPNNIPYTSLVGLSGLIPQYIKH